MYHSGGAEEAEWLLYQFARTNPDALWMYAPDWDDVLFVNDAYETIWGRSIADLIADPTEFLDGVHPDDRERVTDAMADLADGTPIDLEFRVVPPDDTGVRYVWCQGRPVYDEHDELEALAGYVRDVTEQARHERRLEAFNQFLSHDLKNQLQLAEAYLSHASEEPSSDHLEQVEQALDRIDEMTTDLLAMPQADQPNLERRDVSLAALARTCWNGATNPDAELVVDDDSQLMVDRSLFQHVFENLFRNAVEHTEGAVSVRVGSLVEDDGFYIEDNGPGIPADERTAVFDIGHSKDSTGLGLTLVQEIIDTHGGGITITESDTGGARFEITNLTGD